MEFLMFPMKTLRITQGYGQVVDGVPKATFSHGCQPAALDMGGNDTGIDWLYAPCTCIVKRLGGATYNIVYFQSTHKVHCRDGVDRYVCFRAMHCNDIDLKSLGIITGKVFNQGEKFYREGTKGASANHVHIEFGDGEFTGGGCYYSGGGSWSINAPLPLSKICWLASDTVIKNTNGYQWTRLTDAEKARFDESTTAPAVSGVKVAKNTSKSFSSAYRNGKTYTTTANLNMRETAGVTGNIMKTLPKGTKVRWYGYYSIINGTTWKYVMDSDGYTGFVSSNYLKA